MSDPVLRLAVNNEPAGVKHDGDKVRWSLVEWEVAEDMVRVLMYGAAKYPSADNWKRVQDAETRYFNAAIRHLLAWLRDERADPETGLSHLAHAACCVHFLAWFEKQKHG